MIEGGLASSLLLLLMQLTLGGVRARVQGWKMYMSNEAVVSAEKREDCISIINGVTVSLCHTFAHMDVFMAFVREHASDLHLG